ncbi:unnamed protein product [Bursaphelenchus okinawaensis]|uniref:Serine/threonine-protein phosphatase n=1 Tax=Bursaphelenchus okinawaensis TaxID=465554 RepID=A0A811LC29_9BILA|nr:unnamed protein product [Bursaphelenchus okinawaensis]CAG9120219.1 unnamed protein product [Bursaphelenchus okinawaensis]
MVSRRKNSYGSLQLDVDGIITRLTQQHNDGWRNSLDVSENEIKMICTLSREIFMQQPMLLELNAPLKIAGDIHGQFSDLIRLFKLSGFPPLSNYLFLGDYVDRGAKSLETIILLLCYKIKYPGNFFMLRGNHEVAALNRIYGFYDECKRRVSVKVWKSFQDVFNCMPVAALVENKILCCHGGLSPHLRTLEQLKRIIRPIDVQDSGLLCDVLWSDPDAKVMGWAPNDRGVSYVFGPDVLSQFLQKMDLDIVVRGHQVVEDGYEFFGKRGLVTIFSAPNYCGEFDNAGAVMNVDRNLLCSFQILKPQQSVLKERRSNVGTAPSFGTMIHDIKYAGGDLKQHKLFRRGML